MKCFALLCVFIVFMYATEKKNVKFYISNNIKNGAARDGRVKAKQPLRQTLFTEQHEMIILLLLLT